MDSSAFKKQFLLARIIEIILVVLITLLSIYLFYLGYSNHLYILFALGSTFLAVGWFIDLFRKDRFHKIELDENDISFINLRDKTCTSYKASDIRSYNSKIRTKEQFYAMPRRNPYLYFEITFNDGFVYTSTPTDKSFWEIKRWVEEKRIRPAD
ncbi:MAG: hypothetical protein K1X81_14065 [Bacteroidia bacterium]|nr:hypothetical protein [Bacteroidia bacterium]